MPGQRLWLFTGLVLAGLGAASVEAEAGQEAQPVKTTVQLRWRILDHTGAPVPNVVMRLAAYAKGGQPHNETWETGLGTDENGLGEMRLEGVGQLPGYLELEGAHLAIGVVRQRLEWRQVSRLGAHGSRDFFEIRATAGPGLADWREGARAAAPELVRRLLAATNQDAPSLQEQLRIGESTALPALVAAAENYNHPRRQRLTRVIAWIMNAKPVSTDAAVLAKAEPIAAVQRFVWLVPEKPTSAPADIRRLGQACVKELEWAIARLVDEKQDDGIVLPALKSVLAEIRKP